MRRGLPSARRGTGQRAGQLSVVPLAATACLVAVALALTGCAPPTSPGGLPSAIDTTGSPAAAATQPSAVPTPVSPTPSTPGSAPGQPTPTTSGATSIPMPATCPGGGGALVRTAPGAGKTVALTFDDGPGPFEPQIVQVLARYGVRATFFVTGAHAATQPAAVAALSAAGHLVANHTFDHRYPPQVSGGWSPSYLAGQISRTSAVLRSATGRPVCFFRPPGGYKDNVSAATRSAGMTAVLWSVDSLDWSQPATTTPAATAAIVAAATSAGGQDHPVVLLHSAKASHEPESVVSSHRGNTVAALPAIIEWYRDRGYRFVDMAGGSGLTG